MAEKKKMSVADILAAARADKQSGTESEKPATESKTEVPDTGVNELPASEPPASATKPAASKPVSSGRPSVQEMLAMARAGKGNPASEPKATPKPAAKQPSAKKTATAKPVEVDGAKKNVQRDTASILAAARAGAKPGPVSKAEAPALTKPTAKPVAKKVTKAPSRPVPPRPVRQKQEKASKAAAADDRRGFLSYTVGSFMAVGFTALSATGGLFSLGLARFFFPNVLAEPPSRFKVGSKEGFPSGVVETKFVAQYGVWVVNADFEGIQQIYALKTVCTHLGCTPNWLEAEQKFKCPCHGSGFYKDGINFEGPAPRPLERYAISIADDGQLEIDKSKSFQEELGQWNDPASYVTA
jgi:cytochrome b6-f complex iron-sulfur subunit